MGRKKFTKLQAEKKVSGSQKLRIKSRGLNRTLMFSGFSEFMDQIDEEESTPFSDLSDNLTSKLALDDQKQENQSEVANKIKRKKAIQDNVFAIRTKSRSIKDSPVKSRPNQSVGGLLNQSTNLSQREKRMIRKIKNIKTNEDLYAETIAKQLKINDSSLISKFDLPDPFEQVE